MEENSISIEALYYLSTNIGRSGLQRVVHLFLNDLARSEEYLNQLLQQKNLDEIHKVGHRNKTPSRTVGANGLADLFAELEKTDNMESALELNSKILSSFEDVKIELTKYLSNLSQSK